MNYWKKKKMKNINYNIMFNEMCNDVDYVNFIKQMRLENRVTEDTLTSVVSTFSIVMRKRLTRRLDCGSWSVSCLVQRLGFLLRNPNRCLHGV